MDIIVYFGIELFRVVNIGLICVIYIYFEWYGKIFCNILRVLRMMLYNCYECVIKKILGCLWGNWY